MKQIQSMQLVAYQLIDAPMDSCIHKRHGLLHTQPHGPSYEATHTVVESKIYLHAGVVILLK